MKKLVLGKYFTIGLSLALSSAAFASTPRIVADCHSFDLRVKPAYRLVVHEVFGVPHLGFMPHFYKAEFTRETSEGISRVGSFSGKYNPPNSERSDTNPYYKGRNFFLKLLENKKVRPDHKVEAILEARDAEGTDYSEKLLCDIAKLMVI